MNFHLSREDVEMHSNTKSCFYCGKVFDNNRALGRHFRIHHKDRTLRALNFPGCSGNSIDFNRIPHESLPNRQQNSNGGSNLTPITRGPPSIDFSTMFHSNEANQASMSKSIGSSPGVAQTLINMSPSGVPSQISQDGLPPTSGDALKKTRGYNLGHLPFSAAGKVGQSERSLSKGEGSKRPCSTTNPVNRDMMNASKKPEIALTAMWNRRILV